MSNNIASALHDVRRASMKLHEAAIAAKVPANSRRLMRYKGKLDWIIQDVLTEPFWSEALRNALRKDLSSDPLTTESIVTNLDYLHPDDREEIEDLIAQKVRERRQAGERIRKETTKANT